MTLQIVPMTERRAIVEGLRNIIDLRECAISRIRMFDELIKSQNNWEVSA